MALDEAKIRLILDIIGTDDVRGLTKQVVAAREEMKATGTVVQNVTAEIYDFADAYEMATPDVQAFTRAQAAAKFATSEASTSHKNAAGAVEEVATATGKAATKTANLGQTMLQSGRFIQDFAQGGVGGVLNNIEGLVSALGMGPGLAGALTVVGVAAALAGPHIVNFIKSFDTEQIDIFKTALVKIQDHIKEIEDKKIKVGADLSELAKARTELKAYQDDVARANAVGQGKSKQETSVEGVVKNAFAEAEGGAAEVDKKLADQFIKEQLTIDPAARQARQQIADLEAEKRKLVGDRDITKPGQFTPQDKGQLMRIDEELKQARDTLKGREDLMRSDKDSPANRAFGDLLEQAYKGKLTNVDGALVDVAAEALVARIAKFDKALAEKVSRDIANAKAGAKTQEEIEAQGKGNVTEFNRAQAKRKFDLENLQKERDTADVQQIMAENDDRFKAEAKQFAEKLMPQIGEALEKGMSGAELETFVRQAMKQAFPKFQFGKSWAPQVIKAANDQIDEMVSREVAEQRTSPDLARRGVLGKLAGQRKATESRQSEVERERQEAENEREQKRQAREDELLGSPELVGKADTVLRDLYAKAAQRFGTTVNKQGQEVLSKRGQAAFETQAHDALQRLVTKDLAARGVGFGEAEQVGGHAFDYYQRLYAAQQAQARSQMTGANMAGGMPVGVLDAQGKAQVQIAHNQVQFAHGLEAVRQLAERAQQLAEQASQENQSNRRNAFNRGRR
jgi:hypothetical protein